MNILHLLFSFKGSITRFEYVAGLAIGFMIFGVVVTFSLFGLGDKSLPVRAVLTALLYLSSLIMFIIIIFALGSKRLRHLEWSQWLLVLCAIPIAHLFMYLIFFFKPGKPITRTMT